MTDVVPMKQVTPETPNKLKGVLDPLERVVRNDNQLLALAVGGAISAVVVRAVEDLTKVIADWLGDSTIIAPLRDSLRINLLGGKLDVPRIIGILFYIIMSIIVLAALVFGVLSPLIGGSTLNDKKKYQGT